MHDETVVQLLLSKKDLTLQKAVDTCRARENAFANASALASDRLNAVSAYRRGARSYSRARPASRSRRAEPEGRGSGADPVSPVRARDTTPERRCRFCGDEWHQQLAMCPARNHRCSKCNKLHHFSHVCRSGQIRTSRSAQREDRQPDRQQPPRHEPTTQREMSPPRRHLRHLHGIHVRGLSARRTPKVDIEVQHAHGRAVIPWIPDSGAEVCAMSLQQARSIGVDVNHLSPPPDQLLGAAGEKLYCKGTFQCTLRLGEETTSVVTVCVIPNVTGALLSWTRCVELGVLPPDFPKQICRADATRLMEDSRSAGSTGTHVHQLASSEQDSGPSTQSGRSSQGSPRPTQAKYPTWHEEQGEPSEDVKQQHLKMLRDAFIEGSTSTAHFGR